MKQINSIEQLKEEAVSEDGDWVSFFIVLGAGSKSTKEIKYKPESDTFDIFNFIDGSFQWDMNESRLEKNTHIITAIKNGCFYKYPDMTIYIKNYLLIQTVLANRKSISKRKR